MIQSIDPEKCTGCGVCVEVCPLDTLRINEASGRAIIAYPDDCMTCFACEIGCPNQAIDVSPFKEELPPTINHATGDGR